MDFGERVKYARSVLKISQEKLAKLLDVSFSTVNRWEKGHSNPSYLASKQFDAFCEENKIVFDDKK